MSKNMRSLQLALVTLVLCITMIAGGTFALATIMQSLEIEKMIVSDRDNLEGYAIEKGIL